MQASLSSTQQDDATCKVSEEITIRQKFYFDFRGGVYTCGSVNNMESSFTIRCGMGRWKGGDDFEPWIRLSELKRTPEALKERCSGEILIRITDGRDTITVLSKHSCDCKIQNIDGEVLFHDKKKCSGKEEPRETIGCGMETLSLPNNVMRPMNRGKELEPDNRPPVTIFRDCEENRWMTDVDIDEMKRLFKLKGKALFQPLVGGKGKHGKSLRQFTPDLKMHNDVYSIVKKCIDPYIKYVQNTYPSLKEIKLAVLRSKPGAKSQYEGSMMRLHSDFCQNVNKRSPMMRPLSLMVAVDEFNFMYLPDRCASESDIITQNIIPRQAIAFTNHCLHAGGANDTGKYCYRLFAYMASSEGDIPQGMVFQYTWDSKGNKLRHSRTVLV
jgi:hypothetical protein